MDKRDQKAPSPDDFDARLRAAQAREETTTTHTGRSSSASMGLGFRVAIELVAGVVVGVGIGLGLDWWLGSRPWLMVVFLFLGSAAGVMNAYRAAKGMDSTIGLGQASRRQRPDRENGS